MTVPVPNGANEHYAAAQARVAAMAGAFVPESQLTGAEVRQRAALAPVRRADAGTLADLRQFGKAISGVRRSNYRGERADAVRTNLSRDLQRLLDAGDRTLWVDEPAAFGGFGFAGPLGRYNEDTLRFFTVLSLLEEGAVLTPFRRGTPRPTLWEIGGGWGGFAHAVRTICPLATHLVTGSEEQLLLSATYVATLHPQARLRFYDPASPAAFWEQWDEVDVAFAPDGIVPGHDAATAALPVPRLELVVDLGQLERMDESRVARHVRTAWTTGARFILSLSGTRDDKAAGEPPTPVTPVVDRYYWRHPLSTPKYLDRRFVVRRGTCLLGWRRLHA